MTHVITEYSEITPFLYVGTNLCCENHAERLMQLMAQLDISLEAEQIEIPHGFEASLWLPVPDHHAPSIEQLDLGVAAITEARVRGYRVYLHCKNGHGRSPTMAIAYFVRQGMTMVGAEAYVRERRPEIDLTDAQHERIVEYERLRKS